LQAPRPQRKMQIMKRVLAALALAPLIGACSSVGSSAVRTGPLRLPPYSGPVSIAVAGEPVSGADLGLIEVHAAQSEGSIENLVPLFAAKAAQIGGNVGVIDGVRATFEILSHPQVETYTYSCGWGVVCTGTRMYSINDEVMVVSMYGHAVSTKVGPQGGVR
jgi:hypothetical protein